MNLPENRAIRVLLIGIGLTLLFGGMPGPAGAQNSTSRPDSLQAQQLMERATRMSDAAQNDSSNILFHRAAGLFEQSGNLLEAASCHNSLSSNYNVMGKLELAEKHARKALTLIDRMEYEPEDKTQPARSYTLLGLIASLRANYEEALQWLSRARTLIDHPSVSPVLRNTVLGSLGYVHDDLGNYDLALNHYFEALSLLQANPDSPKGKLAKLYNNIGYTYANKGRYDLALEYYKKELSLNLEAKGEDHPDVAGAYLNIGSSYYRRGAYGESILYFQQSLASVRASYGINHMMAAIAHQGIGYCHLGMRHFDQAISSFEKALEIKTRVLPADHPERALSFKNLGDVFREKNEPARAKNYYRQAVQIQQKGLGENHPELADTYTQLASSMIALGENDSALSYLNKAESLVNRHLSGFHPVLSQVYTNRAKASLEEEDPETVLYHYQKALGIVAPSFTDSNPGENPEISDIQYPVHAVTVLSEKAGGLYSLYRSTGEQRFLQISLDCYYRLSDLLDEMQRKYVSEKSKIVVARESHGIYEQAITVAYELFRQSGKSRFFESMFFFSEKSKAQILRESIITIEAKAFANIPDSLLEQEKELKTDIYTVTQKLEQQEGLPSDNADLKVQLQDSLLELNNRLSDHIEMLEQNYPQYHRLKFSSAITATNKMQNELSDRNSAVVEYMWGKESLFALVITPSQKEVFRLDADPSLEEDIYAFIQSINQKNDSLYTRLGNRLYRSFLKPLDSLLSPYENLIIVPDGALSLLPFEALPTHPFPADTKYRIRPYLIKKYSLEYTPSLSLRSPSTASMTENSYSHSLIAFAPVFDGSKVSGKKVSLHPETVPSGWSYLPFSENEVKQISSLFSEQKGFWSFFFGSDNVETYLNRDATEKAFKEAAKKSTRYLHLATHAFISEGNTRLTGIAFHPGEHSTEDGILYVNEIYGLSLNTDLVVLSACETGSGMVIPGEGIWGLSRAFQYAGANHLLVSLWKIEDRSTSKLMESFYSYQLEEENKSRSLQKAKLDLIQSGTHSHPKYWAPFIYIGH